MDYLNVYREMISLRGLTDHTVTSYSTYIRSYLDYLHTLLHKQPEDVSWDELRDFIRWLQKERSLSDRTINHCISTVSHSSVSSPCLSCTNHGIQPSFLCGNSIPTFPMSLLKKKRIFLFPLSQT